MVPTARVEAFHIHKANKRRKKGKKQAKRKQNKKGTRRKCRPRKPSEKIRRFLSSPHPWRGEREREICRRRNRLSCPVCHGSFHAESATLELGWLELSLFTSCRHTSADRWVTHGWLGCIYATGQQAVMAVCNVHMLQSSERDCNSLSPWLLTRRRQCSIKCEPIIWYDKALGFSLYSVQHVSRLLLHSIRIQCALFSSKTFTREQIAFPTGATLCM